MFSLTEEFKKNEFANLNRFLYKHCKTDSSTLDLYNLWVLTEHPNIPDEDAVIWIIEYIHDMKGIDKKFFKEALQADGFI